MKIRAVLFDVYKTLMQLSPPPENAEASWKTLCEKLLGNENSPTLEMLAERCREVIAREHDSAQKNGIASPEIFWPMVVSEALAGFSKLPESEREAFLLAHARLQRTTRIMPGAAEVFQLLCGQKVKLGIVSNAQPYTLHELRDALESVEISVDIFSPELAFWSFENGFSKPDPYVFSLLTARLRLSGIAPEETLVIGDRLDNDILPARAQGFQTWRLANEPEVQNSESANSDEIAKIPTGDFFRLREFLVKECFGVA